MPALAVAKHFVSLGFEVHWFGTQTGIEAKIVPHHPFVFHRFKLFGLRGKKGIKKWLSPFYLLTALGKALRLMIQIRPKLVISMGGYVAGPGGIAAFCALRPLVIQEQNAVPGLTNRCLAPLAKRICVAFSSAFAHQPSKRRITGNPLRAEFSQLSSNTPSSSKTELNILVLGGSQGARAINESVPKAIAQLSSTLQLHVWHQTGHQGATWDQPLSKEQVRTEPFIDDMVSAYQWADVVICRAGALTLAEVTAAGLPSILIPYPYAVDDHQFKNAHYLAQNNAAWVCRENADLIKHLTESLKKLCQDEELRLNMALAAKRLSKPHATEDVVQLCLEVCGDSFK